ncbi:hypothetical protein [Pseudarthrobacter sp. S9]|uniref:hypothetical protein n=1 Tax=Pseudarthrobacter sp. S9 TaxID=3418421 RepID=UPI003CFFFC07
MTRAAVFEDPNTPDWTGQALAAIEAAALAGKPFDAYALTKGGLEAPAHPSMWGQLFKEASRAKIIRKVGYHESSRPGRSRGVCAVWQGASA